MVQTTITDSYTASSMLHSELHNLDHEEVWVLFCTNANIPIGKKMISCGTLTETLIDHRRIIKEALLCNAAGIILYHNHPSGNSNPSEADIKETERLGKCCEVFDISIIDHVIMTKKDFFSFADNAKHVYRR